MRKFMAVVSVLVLALMLGACGGGGWAAPTPITMPPATTVAPAPFARVVSAFPATGSVITPGTRPQVTVEYALSTGSYSDLIVWACLSTDGGVTYIPDTCSGKPVQDISGSKPTSVGELDPGRTSNAIVPLLTSGTPGGDPRTFFGGPALLVRGPAMAHTWVW